MVSGSASFMRFSSIDQSLGVACQGIIADNTSMEDAVPEAATTLTIESISAFNGLDVLVAREEGLFAAEGLDIVIARPRSGERRLAGSLDRGTLVQPASNQGQLLNQQAADLFQG